MLSRVATRVYWLARYLERVENTARMIYAYNKVVLDLPKGHEMGWDILLRITALEAGFQVDKRPANEREIVSFLCCESDNPGSLRSAVNYLRENIRTIREIIPTQTWEKANELFLYVEQEAEQAVKRKWRHHILKEVIGRCQQLTGLLERTMSRDQAYAFRQLGRDIERADMTQPHLGCRRRYLARAQSVAIAFSCMAVDEYSRVLKPIGCLSAARGWAGKRNRRCVVPVTGRILPALGLALLTPARDRFAPVTSRPTRTQRIGHPERTSRRDRLGEPG